MILSLILIQRCEIGYYIQKNQKKKKTDIYVTH